MNPTKSRDGSRSALGCRPWDKTSFTADTNCRQASEDAKGDVNAAVEELLNTISNKFAGVSSEIFAKSEHNCYPLPRTASLMTVSVDEMSRRLDNLEAALLANKEKEGSSKSS